MKNKVSKLPIFMQEDATRLIFQDVIKCIPKQNKVYLVGGAVRNSLLYYYYKKKLPSRDYDLILIGDRKKFVDNLRQNKFIYGNIKRKNHIVLKK